MRVEFGGELAARARLDAAAADLADDVGVEAPNLRRHAAEGLAADLALAGKGRVLVRRLHGDAVVGVACVPDEAARQRLQ